MKNLFNLQDRRPKKVGVELCGACGYASISVTPRDTRETMPHGLQCMGCYEFTAILLPWFMVERNAELFAPFFPGRDEDPA